MGAQERKRVVAITGACSSLGTGLLRLLSDSPDFSRLISIDIEKPDVLSSDLEHHHVDLRLADAEERLQELFVESAPDLVIHGALHRSPHHNYSAATQLEGLGTARLLGALREAPPARLLLLSTTLVYGAHPDNPCFLHESAPLRGIQQDTFTQNKILSESLISSFAQEHSEVEVCTLRFAPTLGPETDNLFTRFLSRPVVPRVSGFDPLIQIVHEDDACRAAFLAASSQRRGAFNIAGGTGLYSALLAELGRIPIPLPPSVAKVVGNLMWASRTSEVPSSLISMIQHPCVADDSRAKRELGFLPQYSFRDTLRSYFNGTRKPFANPEMYSSSQSEQRGTIA